MIFSITLLSEDYYAKIVSKTPQASDEKSHAKSPRNQKTVGANRRWSGYLVLTVMTSLHFPFRFTTSILDPRSMEKIVEETVKKRILFFHKKMPKGKP